MPRLHTITPEKYCAAFETWRVASASYFYEKEFAAHRSESGQASYDLFQQQLKNGLHFMRNAYAPDVMRKPVETVTLCHQASAYFRGVEDGGGLVSANAHTARFLLKAVSKSCLLDRLVYRGEVLRTRLCPEHKGVWSGGSLSSNHCPCQHGSCVTGWLPPEAP